VGPASSIRLWVRRLGAIVSLLTVTSLFATPAAIASVFVRAPSRALQAAPASRMTLAHAPRALQAALRATLDPRSTLAAPSQQAELTPSDSTVGSFGWSVAISGSTAVVGAPFCFHTSCPGAAFVFVRSGSTWSQQAELTASDGLNGDEFGFHIAISGSTVVVGVPVRNSATGVAYVFVRSGSTWSQQAELTASDGVAYDAFGVYPAISGSTMVVGAPGKNSGTGAAYVFVRTGSTWSQQAELTASDGATGDGFGGREIIAGITAVVSATNKNSSTGAVYVFAGSGGTWTQQAELTASDGAAGDVFGDRVAVSGSTVLVTASNKNDFSGAAYVFVNSGGIWSQQAELTASDATGASFGSSVAIVGSIIVVGAPERSPKHQGAVYVFVNSGGVWSQRAELRASDATDYDVFGWSVALYRSNLVVGAPGHGTNGAAYVFVNV
jgi:hypothetical protein